jgi:hypothetical protein
MISVDGQAASGSKSPVAVSFCTSGEGSMVYSAALI